MFYQLGRRADDERGVDKRDFVKRGMAPACCGRDAAIP